MEGRGRLSFVVTPWRLNAWRRDARRARRCSQNGEVPLFGRDGVAQLGGRGKTCKLRGRLSAEDDPQCCEAYGVVVLWAGFIPSQLSRSQPAQSLACRSMIGEPQLASFDLRNAVLADSRFAADCPH